jgi:hypothetical protein
MVVYVLPAEPDWRIGSAAGAAAAKRIALHDALLTQFHLIHTWNALLICLATFCLQSLAGALNRLQGHRRLPCLLL